MKSWSYEKNIEDTDDIERGGGGCVWIDSTVCGACPADGCRGRWRRMWRRCGCWRAGGADPAELGEDRVREYFVHLLKERGYAPQSVRQARAALLAFYAGMLGRRRAFDGIRARDRERLPVVLSRDEVGRIAGLCAGGPVPRAAAADLSVWVEAERGSGGGGSDIDRAAGRLHVWAGGLLRAAALRRRWMTWKDGGGIIGIRAGFFRRRVMHGGRRSGAVRRNRKRCGARTYTRRWSL